MTPVSLTLRDARAIANYFATTGPAGEIDPALRRLARAIARANRALVPGRWRRTPGGNHLRHWPDGQEAGYVMRNGWLAYSPDGKAVVGDGPETGAEGRRLADAALARWAKRQGYVAEPSRRRNPTFQPLEVDDV